MGCHSITDFGIIQHSWPDGGCYNRQDNITIIIFKWLKEELQNAIKEVNR